MSSARSLIQNADETFGSVWTNNHIPEIRSVKGQALTPAYNKGALYERLAAEEPPETGPAAGQVFRGSAARSLIETRHGTGAIDPDNWEQRNNLIDSGVAENATPLVFDPDVLQILKSEAPLAFQRLRRRGQEGYQVVFNNISARESPRGYGPESDTANLQDDARDMTFETVPVDLTHYMDSATITDFSAEASAHYMNLEELAIGARMAEYAQLHEQTVLYGDPGLATNAASDGDTGGPGDPNAFKGLATLYPETGKSGTSSNILEDIKSEIRGLLQSDSAVRPTDLEVWTSWTMFDTLENEFTNVGAQFFIDMDDEVDLDFGNYEMGIGGIPVFPGHNVDSHQYNDPGGTTYSVGDNGDVFIANTRSAEYRELLPLTTIPLARRGAAEEVGMVEFGTLVERSGDDSGSGSISDGSAEFGKYLSAYDI